MDGDSGEAILSPDERTLEAYRAKRTEQLKQRELLEAYRGKPTVDADGNAYQLYANIGSLADAEAAAASSAEGIGLFRTEFLFMDRPALPSEEEPVSYTHLDVYKRQIWYFSTISAISILPLLAIASAISCCRSSINIAITSFKNTATEFDSSIIAHIQK